MFFNSNTILNVLNILKLLITNIDGKNNIAILVV